MKQSRHPYVVVVGVDYSEVSRWALREAFSTAVTRSPSELHALHVESDAHPYPHADTPGSPDEVLSRSLQRLETFVTRELLALQAAGEPLPPAVSTHVRVAAPGPEIAQFAVNVGADLIVVGTHGRSGLARLLLGSVAHSVVSLAACPVLVVRAKELADVPRLEPACPRCVETRQQSASKELWCEQHRTKHGRRHTYHQTDRIGQETNFPLVFDHT
ncbi:MAG: universal stress protein [Polyangiaceae bacterium]